MRNWIFLLLLLHPATALAHPDHAGAADHGLRHLFTDPFHLTAIALAVAAALLLRRVRRRRLARSSSPRR